MNSEFEALCSCTDDINGNTMTWSPQRFMCQEYLTTISRSLLHRTVIHKDATFKTACMTHSIMHHTLGSLKHSTPSTLHVLVERCAVPFKFQHRAAMQKRCNSSTKAGPTGGSIYDHQRKHWLCCVYAAPKLCRIPTLGWSRAQRTHAINTVKDQLQQLCLAGIPRLSGTTKIRTKW